MIRQLRRQLVFIMTGSFTVIIASLVALIAIAPEREKTAQIRSALESYAGEREPFNISQPPEGALSPLPLSDAEGGESSAPGEETLPLTPPAGVQTPIMENTGAFRDFGGNVINIETDSDGTITSWTSSRDDYYDDETVNSILSLIRKNGSEFDNVKGYYFLSHRTPEGYSYTVLDATASANDSRRVFTWTLAGGLLSWGLLFLLSLRLSSLIVRPVEEAFERQNRFIADAGHELKTPIAVIQANADVLEAETGGTKWLSYIKTETRRMDSLVKDLMFLTAMEKGSESDKESIDLSLLVRGASLPFEALAFEKGMSLDIEVSDGIFVRGSSFQLEKLTSILLSNAVKYGEENGKITVSLSEKHKSAVLKVYNTGIGIEESEKAKIFERFYRVDKARSRSDGSYGLGLAMAQDIALNHHGKLTLESEYGKWIEFTYEMRSLL